MIDFKRILADLQAEAAKIAETVELERRVEQGMAGLLGTKGGRKIIGGVAKTGAVAALGALAYRT